MLLHLALSLQLIGQASSLLQNPATCAGFARRPMSYEQQSTWPYSTSVTASVDVTAASSDSEEVDPNQHQPPRCCDWDVQFEELQSFILEKKYPMLKQFCDDQRVEYQALKVKRYNARSLQLFDRQLRCQRLQELGFEFNKLKAKWYDHFHELRQYATDNGHVRVTERENKSLAGWLWLQRRLRRRGDEAMSDLKIKLLDGIGFEWESELYDELWNAKYQELVAFRKEHGNFLVPCNLPLFSWMDKQRQRISGGKGVAALTKEQIRLLDEIEFPWEPERNSGRWRAMYEELQRFQTKFGHCRPPPNEMRLYKWCNTQHHKYENNLLSKEQINLLEEVDFSWKRNQHEWPKMHSELTDFCNTHGHLQVNQQDDPELYEWMDIQRKRYHTTSAVNERKMMPDKQIEKLEEHCFCWSLDWRERTWHDKYTEAIEYFKEHGHVGVTKKENASLHNWIQMQAKRYKELKGQKPLSQEELEMLEQIDFPFLKGQPRMEWNNMFAELERYREENDGRFPTRHKDDPTLNRWLRQQRYRHRCSYGYAPLSADQSALLESVGFPMYPIGKQLRQWCEMYDELVEFVKQHGHFFVNKKKNFQLGKWIEHQRGRFNENGILVPLSKVQVHLLERIEFPWTSNQYELEWQRIYEEVAEFVNNRGRCPTEKENFKLATWIANQRQKYKGNTGPALSESQIQKLEEIGLIGNNNY